MNRLMSMFLLAIAGLIFATPAGAVTAVSEQTYVINSGQYAGHLIWVDRIERSNDGREIVHIAVDGKFEVNVPGHGKFYLTVIGHSPVDREAFENSDLSLSNTEWNSSASVAEGYETWKDDEGGVWTLTVSDVIAATILAIENGL